MTSILFLLVGGLAGFVGATLGIGGGLIIIPALHLMLGKSIHESIFFSLLSVVATSSIVTIERIRSGKIHVKVASSMELFSLGAGLIGATLTTSLPQRDVGRIFSIVVWTLAAVFLALRPSVQPEGVSNRNRLGSSMAGWFVNPDGSRESYFLRNVPVLVLCAILSGVLAGLLGIGGGAVTVPLMIVITGMPGVVATSTSSYIMGVTAAGAAIHYLSLVQIQVVDTTMLLFGVLIGVRVARMIGTVSTTALRITFVTLLVLTGYRMWMKNS